MPQAKIVEFRRKWLASSQAEGEARRRERIAYHERDQWKARALKAEAALSAAGIAPNHPETGED